MTLTDKQNHTLWSMGLSDLKKTLCLIDPAIVSNKTKYFWPKRDLRERERERDEDRETLIALCAG